MNKRICASIFLGSCLVTTQAFAQETRAEQIEQEKAAKAVDLHPQQRERGDIIITRLERIFQPEPPALKPTVGDFRQGGGFAAGIAAAVPALDTGLWTTAAAWSVNNFKQVQSTLEFPRITAAGLNVVMDAKWNDAPELGFFGLKNDSLRRDETRYALRWIEAGLQVNAHVHRWLRFGAGAGYWGTHSDKERAPVFTAENLPGVGARLKWIDARASAAIDTRESPGYTRRGALYGVVYHRYQDPDGRFSFNRTEVDVRQFIPVLHENWVIALQGRAQITNSAADQAIPYFMLPYVGGRDSLPGFDAYRFTDKDSLLLRSELRWTASPMLDMAVFFGEGKVAGRLRDLDFHNLHRNVGVGARFHGPLFTALRVEAAHSVEGWHFTAAHSISF